MTTEAVFTTRAIRATRKAVQALGALNRLEMLSVGSGVRMTGRA